MALADRRVHAGVEDREAGLAIRLRHVHRDIGVADDVGRELGGVPGAGDPDASRDGDLAICDHVRLAQLADQPLRHRLGTLQVGRIGRQDRELIAAETSHEVAVAHRRRDPLGDRDQKRVAGRVAERVVDDLEVVEVDEQDGRHRLALRQVLGRRQDAFEGDLEHAPVRGAGERVPFGEVLHVAQQHGIPEVQRGNRAELGQDRCHATLDPTDDRPRPVLDDDGSEGATVRHER